MNSFIFTLKTLLVFCVFFPIKGTTTEECCIPKTKVSQWHHLTSPDVSKIKLVILPLGATESHGPHLPLATDTILATELVNRAVNNISGVAVLPSSFFGASFEHASFAGTLAIRDDILNGLWSDIIASVVRSGVRKLLLVNGHGGQTSNVQIAIRNARFDHQALAVGLNLQEMLAQAYRVLVPEPSSSEELPYDIHGGLIETSLLLYLRPELVNIEKMRDFKPSCRSYSYLRPYGSFVSYGWGMEDLSAHGALGNAAASTAELGLRIFEYCVAELKPLIKEILEADLENLLNLK